MIINNNDQHHGRYALWRGDRSGQLSGRQRGTLHRGGGWQVLLPLTWMMNDDGKLVGDPSLWRLLSVTCITSADGDQVGAVHHGGGRPFDLGVEQRSDHPFLVDVVA